MAPENTPVEVESEVTTESVEDVEDTATVVAPEIQEVDYGEQDVRSAAHSNGWAAHLVEPEVGGGDVPPDLPDEPEYPGHGKGERPSTALRLTMAGLYLTFGGLLLYAGAVVLHDLWKERK